jgi:hypothetical protein
LLDATPEAAPRRSAGGSITIPKTAPRESARARDAEATATATASPAARIDSRRNSASTRASRSANTKNGQSARRAAVIEDGTRVSRVSAPNASSVRRAVHAAAGTQRTPATIERIRPASTGSGESGRKSARSQTWSGGCDSWSETQMREKGSFAARIAMRRLSASSPKIGSARSAIARTSRATMKRMKRTVRAPTAATARPDRASLNESRASTARA